MNVIRALQILSATSILFCSLVHASTISATDAKNHIGSQAEVCGNVASANHSTRSTGKPIFLNLDRAYPNHVFTVVIFEDYQGNFSYDLMSLKGKDICVSGRIDEYQGLPQIKARNESQIKVT